MLFSLSKRLSLKTRPKLWLFAGLGLLVVMVYFNVRSKDIPSQLVASQVVANNLQFSKNLNRGSKELVFFTGTSLAELRLSPNSDGVLESLSKTSEFAFDKTDQVYNSNRALLIRTNYDPANNLLPIGRAEGAQAGKNWFIVEKNQNQPRLLPLNQSEITDCIIETDNIYCLLVTADKAQKLIKYNLSNNQTTAVIENQQASSFVGATKDVLIARDTSGKLYTFKKGVVKEVSNNVGEVRFDQKSGKVVFSQIEDHELSHESGDGSVTNSVNTDQLTIFDTRAETKQTKDISSKLFFVSQGYLVTLPALTSPDSITFQSLANNDQYTVKLTESKTRLNKQISEVLILRDDLSLIGLVTNLNQLILLGEPGFIDKVQPPSLPHVEDEEEGYTFRYKAVTSILTIFYDRGESGVVEKSISAFESTCECDKNQVHKTWRVIAEAELE